MHLLYNKDLSFTYKQIYVCTIINKLILRIFSLYTQCVIGIALHFVRRLVVFMGTAASVIYKDLTLYVY